jgi:hypothetical protein
LVYTWEDPWATDEFVLPSTWKKKQIWEESKMSGGLPDLSQFQVIHQAADITASDAWQAGTLTIRLRIFAVEQEVENPKSLDRFETHVLSAMRARQSVDEGLEILDQSRESATWKALSAFATFEPRPRNPTSHQAVMFIGEEIGPDMVAVLGNPADCGL